MNSSSNSSIFGASIITKWIIYYVYKFSYLKIDRILSNCFKILYFYIFAFYRSNNNRIIFESSDLSSNSKCNFVILYIWSIFVVFLCLYLFTTRCLNAFLEYLKNNKNTPNIYYELKELKPLNLQICLL